MSIFVGDAEITEDQVFAEMQYHPAATRSEAEHMAATALVVRELLLQEATRLGIKAPDQSTIVEEAHDEFIISRLLEKEVVTPSSDDETCHRYYMQNRKIFSSAEGNLAPFEQVRPAIAAYLQDTSWQTAVRQYIKRLVGKTSITGIHLEGAESPLVQ